MIAVYAIDTKDDNLMHSYPVKTMKEAKELAELFRNDGNHRDVNIYISVDESVSKYRPFKDTEELIDWWLDNYNSHKVDRTYEMPLIWVKRKDGEWSSLITDFTANTVMVNGYVKTMNVLFYDNIFLDGKPCGVEIGKESD
jgi:hypothetical protein